jgi:gliding motility-associated-like protein
VRIFVPNIFTPNDDGFNDFFHPFIESPWPTRTYYFQIFTRWGELVFESSNPSEAWNGTINGLLSNQEVFIWQLEYEPESDMSQGFLKTGDVLVMR